MALVNTGFIVRRCILTSLVIHTNIVELILYAKQNSSATVRTVQCLAYDKTATTLN